MFEPVFFNAVIFVLHHQVAAFLTTSQRWLFPDWSTIQFPRCGADQAIQDSKN